MRHSHGHGDGDQPRARRGSAPAIQVICLGSGGGPVESNVTGFLVRSGAKKWSKNSVLAVDAGVHLGSIVRLLEPSFPMVANPNQIPTVDEPMTHTNGGNTQGEGTHHAREIELSDSEGSEYSEFSDISEPEHTARVLDEGPFKDLVFPFRTARANALHVMRECVSTYLITHPHLDHIAGFVINTAGFHNTARPKKLAALPSTVNAIKTHIFNDVIWPNLTDEDGGVGFVTFQRLMPGGNVAVGEGHGRGYIEVCDGLCVKGMKVSHGHCGRGADTGIHRGSDVGLSEVPNSKRGSIVNISSPALNMHRRKSSVSYLIQHSPGTPQSNSGSHGHGIHHEHASSREVVVDSTAYFIRDDASGREVLIFGDVEPDSVSLNPRNAPIWHEAAPKILHGSLRAIFIECSYDDSQADAILFGHLAPRHLFAELCSLAEKVKAKRHERNERHERKKRKHEGTSTPLPGHAHSHSHSHLNPHSQHAHVQHAPPSFAEYAISKSTSAPADSPMEQMSIDSADGPRKKHRPSDPLHDTIAPHEVDMASPTTSGGGGGGFATPGAQSPADVMRRVSWDKSVGAAASKHMLPTSALASRTVTGDPDIAPMYSRTETGLSSKSDTGVEPPLAGITVVVIHVKDTLKDWPLAGDNILKQLRAYESELKSVDGLGLGCDFSACEMGASYWF